MPELEDIHLDPSLIESRLRSEIDGLKHVRRLQMIADEIALRIQGGDFLSKSEHDTFALEIKLRGQLLSKQVSDSKGNISPIATANQVTGTVVLPAISKRQ